jgi:hypothetical protein
MTTRTSHSQLNTASRPESWRAVVLRDEANGLLAAILTLTASDADRAEEAECAA